MAATLSPPRGKPHPGGRDGGIALGTLFTLPAWIMMAGIGLVPIGVGVYTSLTSQNLADPEARFVGLQNYQQNVFTGTFVQSLMVSLLFVGLGIVVQLPVGYALAAALHRQPRGYRVMRTILIIPMVLTPVALAEAWVLIFNPSLGLAKFLVSGLVTDPNWFGNPALAVGVIVFVDSWINTPFVMVMMLAGMSALPSEPFEAARIDGAGWWMTLRYITLPLLRPVLIVVLLVRAIAEFQLFDIIYVLTSGGPGASTTNLPFLAYRATFTYYTTGVGAALAIAMAVIVLPLYFGFARLTKV